MSSAPTFTLDRVRLRHYRSVGACDVRLGPLAILVGPNGAGKSNFLDALRFTSQALDENLDNALRERGGVCEVRRRSTGHPTHFGVSLDFHGDSFTGFYRFQVAAVKGGDYRVSHEDCRVSPADFGTEDHFFRVRDGAVVQSSAGILPAPKADRLFLVSASGLDEFRAAFDGLSGMNVFNLNPEAMRHLQKPDAGDKLRRDGANVASVLERLRREDPAAKRRVQQYLSRIVEGVSSADRAALGAFETVEFRQGVEGSTAPWVFPATSMSEGTLRVLGVLVALFASSKDVFSPIGVEEPESALHPAAAGLLLDALRDASTTRQVLATSHSPDLLDSASFTPEEILGVRSVQGTTTVAPLDAPGSQAVRDSLFTPGELLRVDQLLPSERAAGEQMDLFA
jgi:predicted ATPase